jgi:MYXO-CTERM domain-containing protein
LRHELGHTLANLADEYQDPYPGYPACSTSDDCTEPNATVRRVRSQIKWLDWIADSTPLPTSAATGFAGVGLFEGARYMASGVYRPVASACKMRSLGNPFCPVCSEALVRSFWNLENVHLIDRVSPAADLAETTCVDATFSVETPDIAPGSTLTFSWTVDGEAATSRANSLLIAPGTLSEGRHQIVVTVKDATSLVRNDPNGSLTESHTLDFNAPACEQMPAAGGAAGTAGTGTAGTGTAGTGTAGSAGATLPAWGGAGTDGGTSAGSPSAGDAGDAGMGATPGMKPPPPKGSLGCGCRLGGSSGSGRPLALAALLGLAAFRRRRSARLLG